MSMSSATRPIMSASPVISSIIPLTGTRIMKIPQEKEMLRGEIEATNQAITAWSINCIG